MRSPGPLFHGSQRAFDPGTVLRGRGDAYEENWAGLAHYEAIRRYAPEGAIPHPDAVFLCDNVEDISLCGGSDDVVILIRPGEDISRHDFNWYGEIQALLEEGAPIDSPEVAEACRGYWSGEPSGGETVWEYLVREAEVIACRDAPDEAEEEALRALWSEMQESPSP